MVVRNWQEPRTSAAGSWASVPLHYMLGSQDGRATHPFQRVCDMMVTADHPDKTDKASTTPLLSASIRAIRGYARPGAAMSGEAFDSCRGPCDQGPEIDNLRPSVPSADCSTNRANAEINSRNGSAEGSLARRGGRSIPRATLLPGGCVPHYFARSDDVLTADFDSRTKNRQPSGASSSCADRARSPRALLSAGFRF